MFTSNAWLIQTDSYLFVYNTQFSSCPWYCPYPRHFVCVLGRVLIPNGFIFTSSFLCGPTLKPDVAAGQCVVNKWNVCCWCASVLEYLTKSDVLNCQHSLYDVMSTSLAQKATLWDFYGHRSASCLGVIEKKKSLRKKIYNRSCESCSIRENVNVLFS